MVLKKDNVTRNLTDKETIKIFLKEGWVEVDDIKTKEPTVQEIKAILKENGIEFDSKANKDELLALLPKGE